MTREEIEREMDIFGSEFTPGVKVVVRGLLDRIEALEKEMRRHQPDYEGRCLDCIRSNNIACGH